MSELKKQAGINDITLRMYGVPFAGTNSRDEYQELLSNMSVILNQQPRTYTDIENYFISWGYQVPMIREIYKKLTGLDPERVNSTDYLLNMPGCIPGFNYGWGEGKGKYKYVFVITYKSGYGVFGQIDDLQRELLQYTLDIEEAFISLNKLAKNVKTYLSVTKVPVQVIQKNLEKPRLLEDDPIAQQVVFQGRSASLAEDINKNISQPHIIRAELRRAYDSKEITAEEHKKLYNYFLQRFAEETDDGSDITRELEKQNIEQVKLETPKEALDTVKQDKLVEMDLNNVALCIKKIGEYLTETLADVYEKAVVTIAGLNFTKKSNDVKTVEKTPEVPGQNPVQYFDKTAMFSLILNIGLLDKKELGEQPALAIFMLDDKGNVSSDGNFKGVNEEIYPLNLSGIENYMSVIADLDEEPIVKE